ncbi:MAG TPA: hypothetical protein VEA69_08525 [Tepidisphaeraceae bacterium]|nr:hypothetical protein [Tepidisphaeraceae bacterium]
MTDHGNDPAARVRALLADRARHAEQLAAIDRALAAVERALDDQPPPPAKPDPATRALAPENPKPARRRRRRRRDA